MLCTKEPGEPEVGFPEAWWNKERAPNLRLRRILYIKQIYKYDLCTRRVSSNTINSSKMFLRLKDRNVISEASFVEV